MKNKTIAIIGSPGCGKTTNAIKLAITLAKHKQNVVLVSLERAVPAIPYIISNFEEQTISLGDLLTRASISQHDIAMACMSVPKNKHVSVIGYQFGDYHRKFPKMVYERVFDFYHQLQAMAPFVIVDCSCLIEEDPASSLALEISDIILRFGSADLKGMSYFHTIDKLLNNQTAFPKEKQLTLISNCWAGQDWQRVATGYGTVLDALPHCPDLAYQYDEMSLWHDLTSKEGYKYMSVMNNLAGRITGNIKTNDKISEIKDERISEQKAEKKASRTSFLRNVIKVGPKEKNPDAKNKRETADKDVTKKKKGGEW